MPSNVPPKLPSLPPHTPPAQVLKATPEQIRAAQKAQRDWADKERYRLKQEAEERRRALEADMRERATRTRQRY